MRKLWTCETCRSIQQGQVEWSGQRECIWCLGPHGWPLIHSALGEVLASSPESVKCPYVSLRHYCTSAKQIHINRAVRNTDTCTHTLSWRYMTRLEPVCHDCTLVMNNAAPYWSVLLYWDDAIIWISSLVSYLKECLIVNGQPMDQRCVST